MKSRSRFLRTGVALLALFVALIFWTLESAPRRERLVERPVDVPLTLVGIPRDLIITTPVQETINVRLRGQPSVLRSLTSQNVEATLDLSGSRAGDVRISIRPQAFNLPDHVEVVSIDPATLSFRLENRRQAVVPIRPFPVGELPPGYSLGEILVSPDQAQISGPASVVRGVTEVATERVILSGRVASFQTTVGVVSDHPLVRVASPGNVIVTVEVIAPAPDPLIGPPEDTTGATVETVPGKENDS